MTTCVAQATGRTIFCLLDHENPIPVFGRTGSDRIVRIGDLAGIHLVVSETSRATTFEVHQVPSSVGGYPLLFRNRK